MRHIWIEDFAALIEDAEDKNEAAEKIAQYMERNAVALDTPPTHRCPPYCGGSGN
jgi:truncated hemoglobin YjbI